MRSNSARAPGFAGSYPVPSPALDDSAFMGSSQPSSNAAPGSDPAPLPLQQEQQKSRYLFHTQDPWCAPSALLLVHPSIQHEGHIISFHTGQAVGAPAEVLDGSAGCALVCGTPAAVCMRSLAPPSTR